MAESLEPELSVVVNNTHEIEDGLEEQIISRPRLASISARMIGRRPGRANSNTSRENRMKSFSKAVQTAVKEINTLKRQGLSSLDRPGPLIHTEDFKGNSQELTKKFLQRMKEFNELYQDVKLTRQIEVTIERLGSKTLNIGVFGRLKSGKSTLLDALTQSEFFPTDSCNPETSVIVGICHNRTVHKRTCEDHNHDFGLKCPRLQDDMGVEIACGSYLIQRKLLEINQEARKQKEGVKKFLIIANVPALAVINCEGADFILQDTPGLGEARNESNSHVTDLAESALLSCCAYIYVMDCSKLRDQLDVDVLTLLKIKDEDLFQDGRLLIVANQFDRTFQHRHQPGKPIVTPDKIKEDVRAMFQQDVKSDIYDDFIIPCSAYWALCARLPYDGIETDLDIWKMQYERAFGVVKNSTTPVNQYIQEASGITQIENWLQAVSLNSKTLLKKSRLSDVIYCHDLCIEACYFYKKKIEAEAQDMASQMQIKKDNWNEAVKLIHDIEEQTRDLKCDIESAYDQDIEDPMNSLSRMTETLLTEFRRTCYSKCGSVTIGNEEEEEKEFRYSSDESEDEWGELVVSSTPPTSPVSANDAQPTTACRHLDLPNRNAYRLIDFNKDLVQFARNLEQRINDSLAQVRFVYIPHAIPLEEFGENKKLLDQLAIVFLSSKPTRRSTDEDRFNPPTPGDIQHILTNEPITLAQLKEQIEIKELKLSWLGRMRVWFQEKLSSSRNVKENYYMKRRDVDSAIQFLQETNCFEECKAYLNNSMKQEIVQCYYEAYSNYVNTILTEYNNNSLKEMEKKASKLEEDMLVLLQKCRQVHEQSTYLVHCKYNLLEQKHGIQLDLNGFTDDSLCISHNV